MENVIFGAINETVIDNLSIDNLNYPVKRLLSCCRDAQPCVSTSKRRAYHWGNYSPKTHRCRKLNLFQTKIGEGGGLPKAFQLKAERAAITSQLPDSRG